MFSHDQVTDALRRYWGYSSFRPLQERIVNSLLGGQDACVVMPTGGGKSLCYQLPAAMLSDRTVVVISPLIALMQDQIVQLGQMGIPAAMLNSTVSSQEQFRIIKQAVEGQYRLLYLSPERLLRADTIPCLKRVPISFFAIDEAHCISEWGHEFRPEYRQLSSLRAHFPELPIAAFTASATRRVRHDIIDQLQLRNPHKYIASFHRANLRYSVRECDADSQSRLLLKALRHHAGKNVIVYAPTIKRVNETVALLEGNKIAALAYHGKMDATMRTRNQERWMSDEVPVLVGTIAFGLGINKASVRAVIHLALPKSVEQYYQEAGRAGRDGEPSDCVLLWQQRDVGLLAYFNNQIADAAEQKRAWQRSDEICQYAQVYRCRHRQICLHFGEVPKWTSCAVCDVCGSTPDWLLAKDPNVPHAARRKSSRKQTRQSPVVLVRPSPVVPEINEELREYLREWRRSAAQQRGLPAFAVMHDTSLDELCRFMPDSLNAVREIHGFGERKTETWGREILAAISRFKQGQRASQASTKLTLGEREMMKLIDEGKTFEEISILRGVRLGTVVASVASLIECGQLDFQCEWVEAGRYAEIEKACELHGIERLRLLKDALPPGITFDEIRLVVAKLRADRATRGSVPDQLS